MKGDAEREKYLTERAALSQELGKREIWSVADAWPLYAGLQNIMRYAFIGSLVQRTERVPGHVAEFGCWRGATTSFIAKFIASQSGNSQKVVHGFDTFEGFDKSIQKSKNLRSGYKGSQQELLDCLALSGLQDAVELHVGDICKTVPKLMEERPELRLSFGYIDVDIYDPCVTALEFVHDRLMPGGIIAFDEWNDPAWPGETQAAEEFLARYKTDYQIESTPVAQPSLVLVRK